MQRLPALLLCALFLAACDAVDPGEELILVDQSTLTRDPALLVGTWELHRVTFFAWTVGRLVQNHNPEPRDVLVFEEDGAFRRYRSGELDQEAEYAVEEECNEQTGACTPVLVVGGITQPWWRGVNEEVLVFDMLAVGGTKDVYVRRHEVAP